MNSFVRCVACLALIACAVHAARRYVSDDVAASYKDAFEVYQINFDKHYDTKEEYNRRLRAYATSMEEVKVLNEQYSKDGLRFGETSRSDYLDGELYADEKLEVVPPEKLKQRGFDENTFPQPKLAQDHNETNIPTEFNWFNTTGVKSPAKQQGQCGSCWAFSAVGQMEMQSILEGNKYRNISVQQAIDCAFNASAKSKGCCGGFPADAYEGAKRYVLDEDYAYNLTYGSKVCSPFECRSDGLKTVLDINGYDKFTAMTASELKMQIWKYGPISLYMSAPDRLSQYNSGIFKCTSSDQGGGHYVVAVGFGPNYLILRNSWGFKWGLEGDFLLSTESVTAACEMIGPRSQRYYQMARVSVAVMPDEPDSAIRVFPIMTVIMLLAFFLF